MMNFQVKDLKKILYSIQNNNINQMKITSNQFELIINRKIGIEYKAINNKKHYANKTQNTNNSIEIKKRESEYIKSSPITTNISTTYFIIVSPMVGTFYRSPAPNEEAFVEPYDIVNKQQTVCIIEAMKLMNEIEAEVYGEIVEILVKDGDIVDCGQALMKVKTL